MQNEGSATLHMVEWVFKLGTGSNSLILSNHLICLPWLLQVGKLVKHIKHITHESHDDSREGFLLRIKQKYKSLFLPSLLHVNLTELFTKVNGPDANLTHRNPSYFLGWDNIYIIPFSF